MRRVARRREFINFLHRNYPTASPLRLFNARSLTLKSTIIATLGAQAFELVAISDAQTMLLPTGLLGAS